jgi:hypothetical protein
MKKKILIIDDDPVISFVWRRLLDKHGYETDLAPDGASGIERIPIFVSGRSKPAREGQMKTSHFESGVAHGAAKAALVRDEPTQREPATFHRHAGGQRLVGAQDCPRTGRASADRRPVFAPA